MGLGSEAARLAAFKAANKENKNAKKRAAERKATVARSFGNAVTGWGSPPIRSAHARMANNSY